MHECGREAYQGCKVILLPPEMHPKHTICQGVRRNKLCVYNFMPSREAKCKSQLGHCGWRMRGGEMETSLGICRREVFKRAATTIPWPFQPSLSHLSKLPSSSNRPQIAAKYYGRKVSRHFWKSGIWILWSRDVAEQAGSPECCQETAPFALGSLVLQGRTFVSLYKVLISPPFSPSLK